MVKKIKLDDNTREQLFGLAPMSADAIHDFTPICYKNILDEDLTPVISIRQTNQEEFDAIQLMGTQEYFESKKKTKPSPKKLIEMAKRVKVKHEEITDACVVGWKNLYYVNNDNEAVFIEYEEGMKLSEKLKGADIVLQQVFTEILKISGHGRA